MAPKSFDAYEVARALEAQTSTVKGNAMLDGLSVKQLQEVAIAAGLPQRAISRPKAALIDSIVYFTIGAPGAYRRASGQIRTEAGSVAMAPKPFDAQYTQSMLQLRKEAIWLQSTLDVIRWHTNIDNDGEPFETLIALRDRFLRQGRKLADFIDEHTHR